MSLPILICLLAIAADVVALGFAVAMDTPPGTLALLLIAHLAACQLFAQSAANLLPPRYRQKGRKGYEAVGFVFGSVVFVPVLAMTGFLASLIPALCHQRAGAPPALWLHPREARLPTHAAEPRGKNAFVWAGSLAGTLQNAADPNKRIAALIATLSIKGQDAVPLWRWALKDPEDEVRLLAYALLNRKEKAIEARIRNTQIELEKTSAENSFALHKALAHDFWELSQLAKVRSSTQLSLCARAREQAEAALVHTDSDGGLRLLLGRILLAEGQFEASGVALLKACNMGVDARQIEPLLAEIAFNTGQYSNIKGHIRKAGSSRSTSLVGTAAWYWEGKTHEAAAV